MRTSFLNSVRKIMTVTVEFLVLVSPKKKASLQKGDLTLLVARRKILFTLAHDGLSISVRHEVGLLL